MSYPNLDHMTTLCKLRATLEATGENRSGLYAKIKDGLFMRGVKLGRRAVGWPKGEIAAINAARIAGKSEEQIRAIVRQIEANRALPPGADRPTRNNHKAH
jgi:prophage regulatory protein